MGCSRERGEAAAHDLRVRPPKSRGESRIRLGPRTVEGPLMTRVPWFRLERLSRMSNRRFKATVYLTALALYLMGVWLHLPYDGGYVYTDLTQLLLNRLWVCPPPSYFQYEGCTLAVPYLQSFNEYPVLTSMFMYVMAVFSGSLPWYL